MEGFAILVGHLVGDYILQNDWMASNKTNPHTILGHLACTVHVSCYTAAIAFTSFWWMPWWGYIACFAIHWVIDRYRLARKWMSVIGQEAFATGPLSPWSIIVVDNVWHLVTLLIIAALSGRLPLFLLARMI